MDNALAWWTEGAPMIDVAPVLHGLALAAAVLLACKLIHVAAWHRRNAPRRAGRPARGRAWVHVGLRLVVCALTAVLVAMFGLLIPTLGSAAATVTTVLVAGAILLVVWTVWPLQRLGRRS